MWLAPWCLPGLGFNVYNVRTGKGWMIDILRELGNILGEEFVLEDRGERPGDPKYAVADTRKIRKELGWKPLVGLRDGLERTVRYYTLLYKAKQKK